MSEPIDADQRDEQMKRNALRIVEVTTRRAAEKQAEWTRRRDDAIAIARRSGASLREIGAAAGLSHVGIKKILDRYQPE